MEKKPNNGNSEKRVANIEYLGNLSEFVPDAATGRVGPETAGEIAKRDTLSGEFIRPGNNFYQKLGNRRDRIIRFCMDGRSPKDHSGKMSANGAGGGIGLYFMMLSVAPELTMQDFADRQKDAGLALSAHDDESGHGTGCGANDRAPEVLAKMIDRSEAIVALRDKLGYGKSTTSLDDVKSMREMLSPKDSKTAGDLAQERINTLAKSSGEDSVSHLHGEHGEVLAVWNVAADNSTLDRAELSKFAKVNSLVKDDETEMEVFNVDAWAFKESATVTLQAQLGAMFDSETGEVLQEPGREPSNDEIQRAIDFLIDYNLATMLVLGNGNLGVLRRN